MQQSLKVNTSCVRLERKSVHCKIRLNFFGFAPMKKIDEVGYSGSLQRGGFALTRQVLKNLRFLRKMRGIAAVLMICLGSMASCVEKKKGAEASGYNFKGITRLEGLSGGRWRVVWSPITAVTRVTYLLYQKEEGQPWDLSAPISRSEENSILSEDLRFSKSQCFLVRALVDGQTLDGKNSELCTKHMPFSFAGIQTITPLDKDGYVLNWSSSTFSSKEMAFEVRRREKTSDLWALISTTPDNFLIVTNSAVLPLDTTKNYCYNVKFVHERLRDDNSKELCSDSAIRFDGLQAAKYVPPNEAELKWQVAETEVPKISHFRVYRISGREKRTLLAEFPNAYLNEPAEDREFVYSLKGVSLESSFELMVRAVSGSVGLEDSNEKTIDLYSQNSPPKILAFDSSKTGCQQISALEKAGQNAREIMGEANYKNASVNCHVFIQGDIKIDDSGRVIPDKVTCRATFTDYDVSQVRMRPRFYFRARLPGNERPVVLRKLDVKGFVNLDPETRTATAEATYIIDSTVDKRGSDLFCEIVLNDTIIDSETFVSDIVSLPDSSPISTGLFISKRLRFIDSKTGSTHLYDDPNGQGGAPGHTCLIATPDNLGQMQNEGSNDICEDTSFEVVIKPAKAPDEILQPGKETEYEGFMTQVDFSRSALGSDYGAFYGVPYNRYRTGYIDPDPDDKASDIQVRNPYNTTVTGYSCLEGACVVSLTLKKDYNSGHYYGDRYPDGSLVPHGEFEYRIRTNAPDSDEGFNLYGVPNAEVGWTKWAKAQIEVTAVDEEPRSSGFSVTAREDKVQKIVVCEDYNDTDPDCALDKNLEVAANSAITGMRYKSNRGKGYYDAEGDPVIKVMPASNALTILRGVNPLQVARWVKPKVASPNVENYADWDVIAEADTTNAALDQTQDFYPFKCDKALRKCVAYLLPNVNENSETAGIIQMDYELWVEVDTVTNPDPSYVGKSVEERRRKSANISKMVIDFVPVNDAPLYSNLLEVAWDEDATSSHRSETIPAGVSPPALTDAASGTYWDPDGLPDGAGNIISTDRVRDYSDVQIKFKDSSNVEYTSYCTYSDEISVPASASHLPGAVTGNECRLQV